MRISVIIPCYNEKHTIKSLLVQVRASLEQLGMDWEIVVIDDCSKDGTREILAGLGDPGIRVILHERNRGKGGALHTGFAAATGDILIVQDADLEYDPREYRNLLAPVLDQKADVVYGSRFVTTSYRRALYFWHMVSNRILTLACNMVSNINLTDMETCYKLFRREVLTGIKLKEPRFGFDPEFTIKVARARFRIYEVGISYSGRTYEEGKKIRPKDAVVVLWSIFKYGVLRFS